MTLTNNGPHTNSNTLKIIVLVVVILVVLFYGATILMRRILVNLLNTTGPDVVVSSLNAIDFTNAKSEDMNQDLSGVEGIQMYVSINKGKVYVDGPSEGEALTGQIKYLGEKPLLNYQIDQDKQAQIKLSSSGQDGEEAHLRLPKATDTLLNIGIGAGLADIDLTDLNVSSVNIGVGAGIAKVTFGKSVSTTATLSAGAGKLEIAVPINVPRRITVMQGAGYNNLQFGEDYIKVNDGYQTKGYDEAKVRIDITIGQALGGFSITPIK